MSVVAICTLSLGLSASTGLCHDGVRLRLLRVVHRRLDHRQNVRHRPGRARLRPHQPRHLRRGRRQSRVDHEGDAGRRRCQFQLPAAPPESPSRASTSRPSPSTRQAGLTTAGSTSLGGGSRNAYEQSGAPGARLRTSKFGEAGCAIAVQPPDGSEISSLRAARRDPHQPDRTNAQRRISSARSV